MKREITEQEEIVYRLRHHNFWGLTTEETAKKMKISSRKVRSLLKNLKRKAPQLFPIFTHRQYLIYSLYTDMGLSQYQIAIYLHTTQSNIWGILNRLKKKGVLFFRRVVFTSIAYEKNMDDNILYKF